MLKKEGCPDPATIHSFEQHWPNIKPITRKLILNESITITEWQDLFYDVHMICSWDQEGARKLLKNLDFELRESYIKTIRLRLLSIECDLQQLKEYINCWNDFKRHCDRFPVAFQQLDLATRTVIHQLKPSYPPQIKKSPQTGEASAIKRPVRKQNDSTVRRMMLKLWDEQIVGPLERRLLASADEFIWSERNGDIIDSRLIIGLRDSFNYLEELSIKNYMQRFREIYINSIEMYYTTRADEYFRSHEVTDYIEWALNKLESEDQRATLYLEVEQDAATQGCRVILINNYVEQVLISSRQYIDTNDIDNMKLIHRFLSKLEGAVERYFDRLGNHIVTAGLDCLVASNSLISTKPDKFFEKLLDIHNQYSKIVSISFDNDPRAKLVLDKAFRNIVNDPRIFNQTPVGNQNETGPTKNQCAELVANYCNLILRRSTYSRRLTSDDLTNRLNEVLLIVKLLKNKESFVKFHKIQLMRRLILDASISVEKEEEFVSRLKELSEIPIEQINELVRMFRDLKASDILHNEFVKTLAHIGGNNNNISNNNNNNNNLISNLSSQVNTSLRLQENNNGSTIQRGYEIINVKILNPSAWTKMKERCTMKLDNEISSIIPSFESYYESQFVGRKLDWCHNLSNGVITFTNNQGGKFDLEVTGAQLAILSSFNEQPTISKTLKELEVESGLGLVELKRTLWSLVSNPKLKVQIMNCKPEAIDPRNLDDEDANYSINHDFVLIKNGKAQSRGRICLIGRLQL